MKLSQIKKVSCIGSGVIGYSFALSFALNGLDVWVYDISSKAIGLAKTRVKDSLKPLIEHQVIKKEDVESIIGRIHYTMDIKAAVENSYFIQESGPEHYEVKWEIIENIEKYAPKDAIIASSTSGLLITEIAKNSKHPERFVGAHPYNPPHLIPLIEITKGEKTTDENVEKAKDFFTSIGKVPVVLQREALGFICNRLQMALYREVCELVMRGVCTVEDADKAVTYGPGIRWGIMGPSLIFQLGGGTVGVDGLMNHLHDSIDLWLNDMADWKEFPEDWPKIAREGVEESLKNRPKEIGNDEKSLEKYRDDMLIEILKLHKKL
jgi:carnitine 3-dehydrogenase